MLLKRILVRIEIRAGRVAGDVRIGGVDPLDPVALACHYEAEGADELLVVDISATEEEQSRLAEVVRHIAERVYIPVAVGGGIRDLEHIERILQAGADKVALNTAVVELPEIIGLAAERFGSEALVVSIDSKLERRRGEMSADPAGDHSYLGEGHLARPWYRVYTHMGSEETRRDAIVWAREAAERGAGEILVCSIDEITGETGFDLELTARISEAVPVSVSCSGAARAAEHFRDAFLLAGADGAAGGALFHEGETRVAEVKRTLVEAGVPVRPFRGRYESPAPVEASPRL